MSSPKRGLVSVPFLLAVLSDQLPVEGSVGRYPTDYLIGRRPIPKRVEPFDLQEMPPEDLIPHYPWLRPMAIGDSGAGCLRVTKPFATTPFRFQTGMKTFDLQV